MDIKGTQAAAGVNQRASEEYRQTALKDELDAFLQSADRLAARLSDTLGMRMASTVKLESGPYLLWTLPLTPAPASRGAETPVMALKTESELRSAVIDRLIAASLSESKPAWETTLEQWRTFSAQKTAPTRSAPKAG